jgi:hypothetical protein
LNAAFSSESSEKTSFWPKSDVLMIRLKKADGDQ